MIYRFDSFELDGSQYRLSRGQETIHLKPNVFELLAFLIEHRDRVVTKEELVSTLWRGRFVSDNVLSATVYEARRALGEDAANARFIKTLHARGYQFHFRPVEVISGGAGGAVADVHCPYVQWPGGGAPLRPGEHLIGRDPACTIVLQGRQVSRQHARIVIAGQEAATIEDLGSKNGTLVNGQRITSPGPLTAGDVIEVGGVPLSFQGWLDLSTVTQGSFARRTGSVAGEAINEPTARDAPPPRTR